MEIVDVEWAEGVREKVITNTWSTLKRLRIVSLRLECGFNGGV